jgi:hypothetical protein
MSLSRIELEQIQQNREYLDQYTAAQTQALGESQVDLQGVMNHVFSAIKRVIRSDASGVGDWKDAPAASLYDLNDASGILSGQVADLINASGILSVDISQINSFIGRADGESNPTYSSNNYVNTNDDVETAIGKLDAQLAYAVAGSGGSWQQHFDNGNGDLEVDGTPQADITFSGDGKWTFNSGQAGLDQVFSSSGCQLRELGFRKFEVVSSQYNPGDTVTIPDSYTYTPDSEGINLRVFHNGQLLLPGSGVTSTDENYNDYREVNSTSIVTNVKLKTDAVLQFHING